VELVRNNNIPVQEWERLAGINIHSTPFQSYDFYSLVNSIDGLTAEALSIAEEGHLRALVVVVVFHEAGLKGFFSRRAIIYGGPLIDDRYPDALERLLVELATVVGNRVIYTETRNLSDYSDYINVFSDYSWKYLPYCNFKLQTSDAEVMAKAVSSSRMRQIRKAIKSGVKWREALNIIEVETFYEILSRLYAKRIRKPVLPREFFRLVFERHFGIYLLVFFNDKIIGGIMCPVFKGRALYEFYICGLDREYREQYPSIIATWAAMEYANKTGIPIFDFMGAGKSGTNYGVREFKAKFGGDLVEFGRFRRVYRPLLFGFGKIVLRLRSLMNI